MEIYNTRKYNGVKVRICLVTNAILPLLNERYRLGGHGNNDGIDCIRLIYLFYKNLGIDLPIKFDRYTIDNYVEYWKNGLIKLDIIHRYFLSFCTKVNSKFILAGDIILYNGSVALYVGNNNVCCIFEDCGVKIMPIIYIKRIDCNYNVVRYDNG